ncbi:MAG: hypothetical protein IJQ06_02570 [Paludibacteraceae bacterium]|nr:hypothetical protein [Paludibacteraceae bacterium]
MQRYYFIIVALCVCLSASAARSKKVETFDANKWHWTENVDKYQYVAIEDGFLVIKNIKINKKATAYGRIAKSYARLPLRPQENFKLTIKYLLADYKKTYYWIWFNLDKQCLEEDVEPNAQESYFLTQLGPQWILNIGDGQNHEDKLPGKVITKGEYPMEFVIEKRGRNASVELNGILLYEGEMRMTNPCIGFWSPLTAKNSYIKIDEVIVEQAEPDDN